MTSKVDRLRQMREAQYEKYAAKPILVHPQADPDDVTIVPDDTPAPVMRKVAAKLLGAKGGKSKSPAKQSASRANGKKGGKPKHNPSA